MLIIVSISLVLSMVLRSETLYVYGSGWTVLGTEGSVTVNGRAKTVYEYLGIPYAVPPLRERRFKKAEEAVNHCLNCTSLGPSCLQLPSKKWPKVSERQSEDCLTLNIYVPGTPTRYSRPVLIWIHGGDFFAGRPDHSRAKYMAAAKDIVVVTLNYRLGVFGFLSSGDDTARGNFGLWDQQLAIGWVFKYIKYFWGNKNKITIGGDYTGATSCLLQAIPSNKGLFHNIVLQSVAGLSSVKVKRDGASDVLKLATAVGCPSNISSINETIQCLRYKSADSILNGLKFFQMTNEPLEFYPVIDDEYLQFSINSFNGIIDEHSAERLKFLQSLNIFSGFNVHNGAYALKLYAQPEDSESLMPNISDFDTVAKLFLKDYLQTNYMEELQTLISSEYTISSSPYNYYNETQLKLKKLVGDILHGVPALEIAYLHQTSPSSGRCFLYHHTGELTTNFQPGRTWVNSTNRMDELMFIFGTQSDFPDGANFEFRQSQELLTFLASFVEMGDPNSVTLVNSNPIWPAFDTESQFCMTLGTNISSSSAKPYFYADEANFWLRKLFKKEKVEEGIEHPTTESTRPDSAHTSVIARYISEYVFVVVTVLFM